MKFMHKEVRQLGDPCMSILYPLYERRKARSIAGALLHDLFNFCPAPSHLGCRVSTYKET